MRNFYRPSFFVRRQFELLKTSHPANQSDRQPEKRTNESSFIPITFIDSSVDGSIDDFPDWFVISVITSHHISAQLEEGGEGWADCCRAKATTTTQQPVTETWRKNELQL